MPREGGASLAVCQACVQILKLQQIAALAWWSPLCRSEFTSASFLGGCTAQHSMAAGMWNKRSSGACTAGCFTPQKAAVSWAGWGCAKALGLAGAELRHWGLDLDLPGVCWAGAWACTCCSQQAEAEPNSATSWHVPKSLDTVFPKGKCHVSLDSIPSCEVSLLCFKRRKQFLSFEMIY